MKARAERQEEYVRAWLEARVRSGASAERIAAVFVAALRAIWSRSRTSLGDVTLAAIFNRVLGMMRTDHPILERLGLEVREGSSIELSSAVARDADPGEVFDAARVVLVELLHVLGRLTGETLTPILHEALSAVAVDEPTRTPSTKQKVQGR